MTRPALITAAAVLAALLLIGCIPWQGISLKIGLVGTNAPVTVTVIVSTNGASK